MRRNKKSRKGEISGYNELLAIKKELRKNINEQEEYFTNDLLSIDKVYGGFVRVILSKVKNNEKVFDNSNILTLNDLISNIAKPYVKESKQKQAVLPVISLGISFFVINVLNNSFRKKQAS